MKIKLKEETLNSLLQSIEANRFATDGCACGSFGYKLDDNLFLYAYRSCRKSSCTPEHKWWHIDDIEFYSKGKVIYYEHGNVSYIGEYEVENDDFLENVQLDEWQYGIVLNKLKEVTIDTYGEEYKES